MYFVRPMFSGSYINGYSFIRKCHRVYPYLRQFNGGWLQIKIATFVLRHRRNNERTAFLKKQARLGGITPEEARASWNQRIAENRAHDRLIREAALTGLDQEVIPSS